MEIKEMADDTISRKVAIDAVHKNYDVILDFTSDGQTISSSIEDILSGLPSTQPEIIRCKDCKYWSEYEFINGKRKSFPWCELHMKFSKKDDFCSHAERRTYE